MRKHDIMYHHQVHVQHVQRIEITVQNDDGINEVVQTQSQQIHIIQVHQQIIHVVGRVIVDIHKYEMNVNQVVHQQHVEQLLMEELVQVIHKHLHVQIVTE